MPRERASVTTPVQRESSELCKPSLDAERECGVIATVIIIIVIIIIMMIIISSSYIACTICLYGAGTFARRNGLGRRKRSAPNPRRVELRTLISTVARRSRTLWLGEVSPIQCGSAESVAAGMALEKGTW